MRRKRVMGEGKRSKLNVPQGSVWGHGAAFLPRVKGHLSRGIINKLGINRKRYRDRITHRSFLHINTHWITLH